MLDLSVGSKAYGVPMATTEAPTRRYRIGEVGRLTGFEPTTLRFYENAGVLAPPPRTPAGYRSYDDRDVERLRLIARAKDLGCTLDEIADLVQAWDADECGEASIAIAGRSEGGRGAAPHRRAGRLRR